MEIVFGIGILIVFLYVITTIYVFKDDKTFKSKYFPKYQEPSHSEYELLNLINNHRNSLGLRSLMSEETCYNLAKEHNEWVAGINEGKASHNLSLKRKEIIQNMGFDLFAEISGAGWYNNKSLFAGYLRSEKHKLAIEHPDFTHIGVSNIISPNNVKCNVIIFASHKNILI